MTLTLAESDAIIDAVISTARGLQVNVCVAVCNPQGRLVAFKCMDGTYAEAGRSAVGKAVASAATGQPSGEITHVHEHLAPALVIAEGMPVSRIPGGLPVWRGGVIQGACGVAGAPSNDLDEMCARAGVAGFGTYAPR